MIQIYNKDKNIIVMIWTCFEDNNWKFDLVFISDDPDLKWEEITSAIYLKVIEEQLPILWESGLIFMQDGASIHTAHIIKNWLTKMGIKMVD